MNQRVYGHFLYPICTVKIAQGTKEFIFRLTNPDAEAMNQKTRVENEMAIISLAASALSGFEPHVVPSVYGWGSAATLSSQGLDPPRADARHTCG